MTVSAASTDGIKHSVQVYTDISAEWVSGDTSLTANWTTSTGSILTHQVQLTDPSIFSEVSDHTQCECYLLCSLYTVDYNFWKDGSAFYSTISVCFHILAIWLTHLILWDRPTVQRIKPELMSQSVHISSATVSYPIPKTRISVQSVTIGLFLPWLAILVPFPVQRSHWSLLLVIFAILRLVISLQIMGIRTEACISGVSIPMLLA